MTKKFNQISSSIEMPFERYRCKSTSSNTAVTRMFKFPVFVS